MTINEAITIYMAEDARAKEAAKKAKAAKEFILAAMGDGSELVTDLYTVYLKTTTSSTLDTKALYKDFPDIKETYGRTSVSKSIDPHRRADAAMDAGKKGA